MTPYRTPGEQSPDPPSVVRAPRPYVDRWPGGSWRDLLLCALFAAPFAFGAWIMLTM